MRNLNFNALPKELVNLFVKKKMPRIRMKITWTTTIRHKFDLKCLS
jgi:hypothetical protein